MLSLTGGAYVLFFALSAVIVVFSVLMLFSKNFVHSAVYLAVALLSFAGVYALLSATFIALLQVFIYAGAVTIVVIFVIMMTRVGVRTWGDLLQKQSWVAAMVVTALSIGLVNTMFAVSRFFKAPTLGEDTTVRLAELLFKKHLVAFELASVILLVALIGAIYLAKEAEE
ncbi:MAG: NADH-quinone oxidoreductase subunit J family protein [Candidatus Aquicultorales bacterium]